MTLRNSHFEIYEMYPKERTPLLKAWPASDKGFYGCRSAGSLDIGDQGQVVVLLLAIIWSLGETRKNITARSSAEAE